MRRNEERQVKGGWIPRCEPEPRAGFGESEGKVDGGQYGLGMGVSRAPWRAETGTARSKRYLDGYREVVKSS